MATLLNMDGTDNSDNLKFDAGGNGIIFNTGAGKDIVTIVDGSITVNNKSGNDVFNLRGGSEHTIVSYGGNSSETLEINGANKISASLGSGKDIINIHKSNGRNAQGFLASIRGGDWGDVFTTYDGANGYNLYGDQGDDIFNINNGSALLCWGGAANDTFIVKGGSSNKLFGGDSADLFEIYVGNQNIVLGYGNDVVNIYEGNYQNIKGNLGINQINLLGGSRHNLNSDIDSTASAKAGHDVGYGVDQVLVDGATQVTANLGDGKDVVELRSGSSHRIHTEGWGDTVRITGPASNSMIYLDAGDDTAYIEAGDNNTIYGNEGKDSIFVSGGTNTVIYGGEDKDLISIAGGEVKLVDLGSGDDFVQINGGTLHTLKVSSNNTTVVGGMNEVENLGTINLIQGNRNDDNLTISGQVNIDEIAFDSGSDILTVLDDSIHISKITFGRGYKQAILKGGHIDELIFNSENKSLELSGISNFKASLLSGNDSVKVTDGYNLEVYGGLGNETFNISGGRDSLLLGENGNDYFNITGGERITVSGGFDVDTFLLKDGTQITVKGDEGNDIITISGGSENLVYGGVDKDTINLQGGKQIHVYGNEDDDIITVSGGSQSIIEAGEGNDLLTLKNGENHLVMGNTGNNTFIVQGGYGWKLYGGNQNDNVQVKGGQLQELELGEGENLLQLESGSIDTLLAGPGLDRIESTGGTITKILGTSAGEQIEITGNTKVNLVDLGDGENTIILRDAVNITQLDLRKGSNTIEWYGGNFDTVLAEANLESLQRNKLNIYNASKTTLNLTNGGAEVNVLDGSSANINLSDKADIIRIKSGNEIKIDCGLGNDLVEVLSGTDIHIIGNGAENMVRIDGGENISYTGTKLNEGALGNTLEISGGHGILVQGTAGKDAFSINGGQEVELSGGDGDDTFLINGGNQVILTGGNGNDTYTFQELQADGRYIINQSITGLDGTDYINITLGKKEDFKIKRKARDVVLTYLNGATINIKNWTEDKSLNLQFADSEILSWNDLFTDEPVASADSQLDIMQSLMSCLSNTAKIGYDALDEAVVFSSQGRFDSFTSLVQEFKGKILAGNYTGNEEIAKFYEENCGIILNNADTGSIVGSDCGGPEIRDKESIVQEAKGATLADCVYDNSNKQTLPPYNITYTLNTNDGITYYWVDKFLDDFSVSREICEQIIGGVVNVWGPAAWNLVEEATGLSMLDKDCFAQKMDDGTIAMQINLSYEDNGALASMRMSTVNGVMTNLLTINTYYFEKLMTDINGDPSSNRSAYLDRVLAHEFTHAACFSNINSMMYMPEFFTEGIAELVHGIDDFRTYGLYELARTTLRVTDNWGRIGNSQKDALDIIFDLTTSNTLASGAMSYCGGYALLRYYAKQVMDYASAMDLAGNTISYLEEDSLDKKQELKISGNV